MKKLFEKFKPIKIKDEELLETIKEIKLEKSGFTLMMLDIAKARKIVENKQLDWFNEVIEKYNIPEEYSKKLVYDYKKKEIRLKY